MAQMGDIELRFSEKTIEILERLIEAMERLAMAASLTGFDISNMTEAIDEAKRNDD